MPSFIAHYRGYLIERSDAPDWARPMRYQFAPKGDPESNRCGFGMSADDCRAQIDDMEDDQ